MNYLLSSFVFAVVQLFERAEYETMEKLKDLMIDSINVAYMSIQEHKKSDVRTK